MRGRGGRLHGEIPSPRRLGHLRHAGPAGPGMEPALPAGGRPGQLRVHRRRQPGGDAVHGVPDGAHRVGDAGGHQQGDGGLAAELRRPRARAERAAVGDPEPAGERVGGHRRGHGDQLPAPQPARGLRRRRPLDRQPGSDDRGPDAVCAGSGLPDGRHDLRRRQLARCVQDGPGQGDRAGQGVGGARQEVGPRFDHRRGDPLPGQQGAAHREHRRPRKEQNRRGDHGPAGRVGPGRHAHRHRGA
jgi:hypothetical protein